MADLGVAHLAGRQADRFARGFERAARVPLQQVEERRRLASATAFWSRSARIPQPSRMMSASGPVIGLLQLLDGGAPRVLGARAERLLDAEQLVVLGDAVAAAQRAGLDLAGARADGEVGDRRILGLAGAVRGDRRVAGGPRSAIACSVSVTVPIWLTLTSSELAMPLAMPSLRITGLVTNTSSPTSCTLAPSALVSRSQPASRPR